MKAPSSEFAPASDLAVPTRVDAVITWVDGSDPAHRQARKDALRSISPFDVTTIRAGLEETRFSDNGELLYCIRCIRAFTPWVHTIHLVTAGQRPSYLSDADLARLRVNMVDHREVFRGMEWALPTFNSQSIETVIHRIDELAEHFLYFNDDFLILRSLRVEDFFPPGQIVARGRWSRQQSWNEPTTLAVGLVARLAPLLRGRSASLHAVPQIRAAQMAGVRAKYLKAFHVPYAVRKSSIQRYFSANPAALMGNIGYRFRNLRQFNAMPLATHLELAAGTCRVEQHAAAAILNFTKDPPGLIAQTIAALKSGGLAFVCLQDFEHATEPQRKEIVCALEELLAAEQSDNAGQA